jgi:GNAT superfamily N-acetyltransferase
MIPTRPTTSTVPERRCQPAGRIRQDTTVELNLEQGFVLDDDRDRIDPAAVHAFLTTSYWAAGRTRDLVDELIATAARVVGLYAPDGRQVGFTRTVSDGRTTSYLADVYVLEEFRGRGLGVELVRFTVEAGDLSQTKWLLHTRDMHRLYARFGFASPDGRLMERWPSG